MKINSSGLIELQARATDNQNNESVSGVETISVVRGESPTVNIASPLNGSQVTSGDVIEILLNVADTDGIITSVSVFKGGSSSGQALPTEVAGQYRYDLSTDINDVGSLDIWALANDEMGNRGYSNIVSITVEKASPKVTAGDPLTNDATFVNEVYLKLFNQIPSVAQLQEGLSVLTVVLVPSVTTLLLYWRRARRRILN